MVVGKTDFARGVFKMPATKMVTERRDILKKFDFDDVINIIGLASIEKNPVITQVKASQFRYFSLLAMIFVCGLVLSNLTSSKLIDFFGITLTGGMLPYLITYSISGLITEVYGYKRSRQLIWGAVFSNIFFAFFIWLSVYLKPSEVWHYQKEYSLILMAVPRVVFSSIISYVCSEFLNSYLIAKLKIYCGGHKLWIRMAIASSIAISIDNFLFFFMSYSHTLSIADLIDSSMKSYVFSLIFEWAFIPFVVFFAKKLKNIEQVDIFDMNTNFNPFSLDVDYR